MVPRDSMSLKILLSRVYTKTTPASAALSRPLCQDTTARHNLVVVGRTCDHGVCVGSFVAETRNGRTTPCLWHNINSYVLTYRSMSGPSSNNMSEQLRASCSPCVIYFDSQQCCKHALFKIVCHIQWYSNKWNLMKLIGLYIENSAGVVMA